MKVATAQGSALAVNLARRLRANVSVDKTVAFAHQVVAEDLDGDGNWLSKPCAIFWSAAGDSNPEPLALQARNINHFKTIPTEKKTVLSRFYSCPNVRVLEFPTGSNEPLGVPNDAP